jgi:hypothetical protein
MAERRTGLKRVSAQRCRESMLSFGHGRSCKNPTGIYETVCISYRNVLF